LSLIINFSLRQIKHFNFFMKKLTWTAFILFYRAAESVSFILLGIFYIQQFLCLINEWQKFLNTPSIFWLKRSNQNVSKQNFLSLNGNFSVNQKYSHVKLTFSCNYWWAYVWFFKVAIQTNNRCYSRTV
jgi:hypothetical protein